ncbi:MAG: DUF1660 family phage protein [Candidatus Bathyarchaeota archaeon]|nr:DUF1660 family phage protein [Candidatus Bathyarchaeota archaeon]
MNLLCLLGFHKWKYKWASSTGGYYYCERCMKVKMEKH